MCPQVDDLAVCDVAGADLNLRWSEHLKVLDQLKKDEDDLIRILKVGEPPCSQTVRLTSTSCRMR